MAICTKWDCKVNKKLLPVKCHLFLYASAIATILPFCPIIAKNLGITATAVGIIYTVVPFTTIIVSPFFGWIADKFKHLKFIIIILIIIQTPFYFAINHIPPINKSKQAFSAEVICNNNNSYALESSVYLPLSSNNSMVCYADCHECFTAELFNQSSEENLLTLCRRTLKLMIQNANNNSKFITIDSIISDNQRISLHCSESMKDFCKTECILPGYSKEKEAHIFSSYQFWTILFLMASSLITTNVIISLSDAACYEELEEEVQEFGKQKLWYSIGWALITMLTAYIVEVANTGRKKVDYSHGFYMMIPLVIFDIVALLNTDLRKRASSTDIIKDIAKIFRRPHPFFIVFVVCLVGMFSGLQWSYKFWYLEDMGANKLLFGLCTIVSCFFGEVPCLFLSGHIINFIGRDNSMCLALLAFSSWFLAASYIYNPWWILLMEWTQGPCYGIFYAAMSSFAKITAPPGTEATMQTILGATFYGLGVGSGSLLGGFGFDMYGGRKTFRFAGFFALASALLYKFITEAVENEKSSRKKHWKGK
ncbi:major facilitator superfamily domain-containing protein 6-like [Centruroides sculpturatus]|uniref:major facilitator superfamily domain-containing protein 6-like n=1 Tax=Centruroides sculpturatus TaxID=218467 RepID=UPI000C6D355D|nr:major facilitator superfamily domain-containing protein 6-like [Centruroides sculpturatus]